MLSADRWAYVKLIGNLNTKIPDLKLLKLIYLNQFLLELIDIFLTLLNRI